MPCTANDIAIALFDNFNEVILEHVNAPINVKPHSRTQSPSYARSTERDKGLWPNPYQTGI